MSNDIKIADLDTMVVRSNKNEAKGRTLDEVLYDFCSELDDDEIVICEDGRCYQIRATYVVEEISKAEAAELAGWDLAEVS